jgi:hypothetical protein
MLTGAGLRALGVFQSVAPSSCKMDSDNAAAMGHWEQERAKKKRRIESKSSRFVSLNDDNFRRL